MFEILKELKNLFELLEVFKSVKIGREADMTADSYPLCRIVPSKTIAKDFLSFSYTINIFVGIDLKAFEDLEMTYKELSTLEANAIEALNKKHLIVDSILHSIKVVEILGDEDTLENYKVSIIKIEIEEI